MSKTYSAAPDADDCIEKIRDLHHEGLEGVTIAALFAFDSESSLPVLTHQGYPAGAIVRITPLKDRAMGMADAQIVIDRAGWLALSQRQRDALIDHELTHLEVKTEEEEGAKDPVPVFDSLDRPKLKMRKHDHQIGFFTEVAQRHGDASPEMRLAQHLMTSIGQMEFDFQPRPFVPGTVTKGTLKDGTTYTVERTA